jgi:putative 4-mercaptohistidine N1-methyltranferase
VGDMYEDQKVLAEYLLFHYGEDRSILPWDMGPADALHYPVNCAELVIEYAETQTKRALDLGCAVGRSSFELSRVFDSVVGIDFSHAFIQAAQTLRGGKALPFASATEGSRTEQQTATLPEGVHSDRVLFQQGDACALPKDLGTFDAVLMANLIDRLYHPQACLDQLPGLVKPGGIVVLTSPYTWMDTFTPPENWIGGTEKESTGDALVAAMGPSFERIDTFDLPFLIREHQRKFQWSVAEATIWKRR